MDNTLYDVAIIGTGMAGLSASLTLQALNKQMIWFGNPDLSTKIRRAERIHNYPGLPDISGEAFVSALQDQIKQAGLVITPLQVTGVYAMGDYFSVLCNNEMFRAKTVILCTGVEAVKPIEGELEYVGRGVSYCATCDGFLYKDKEIAVVCTDKEFEEEIAYLATLARTVHLVPLYQGVSVQADNIVVEKGAPTAVLGGLKVNALQFKDRQVAVDGVFMLKSAVTPSVLVGGLKVENGSVVIDSNGATNLKGCFAAGDCTGRPYQYAKAVGQGNVSAHAVNAYLAEKRN